MIAGVLLSIILLAFTGLVDGATGDSTRLAIQRQSRMQSKRRTTTKLPRRELAPDDDDDERPGGKAKAGPPKDPLSPPRPPAPAPTDKPVYVLHWGTSWDDPKPTAAPTPDMTLERICQAAENDQPYESNNHVLVNYQYQVMATGSLTASSVPDAVGRILTEDYILRHCGFGMRRRLLSNPGDVQSIASYQATLLLDHNCTVDCEAATHWKGTNRVYFRDDYEVTEETEATILNDIIAAFESGRVLTELQKDTTVERISFVTGSGATTAIVDEVPPETSPTSIEAKSKDGMKPIGIAFISIAAALVAVVALFGWIGLKRKKRRQPATGNNKNLSQVHLGTFNTMEDDDDFDVLDNSNGFVQFRPNRLHVDEPHATESLAGYGAEMMYDDHSSVQTKYTNPLRRNISIDDPRDTHSMAGFGAEMRLRDSKPPVRFTPNTLPNNDEVQPSIHHLDASVASFGKMRAPTTAPRNYRVPDTLDL